MRPTNKLIIIIEKTFSTLFWIFEVVKQKIPTWTHVKTSAANVGVNCIIWLNDSPSKSNITQPPQTCVVGSSIDAAIVTWIARNKSFNEHFDGFHFSVTRKGRKKLINWMQTRCNHAMIAIPRKRLKNASAMWYLLPHSITKIRDPLRSLLGIKRTSSCSNTWATLFGYKSSYKFECFCFSLKNVIIYDIEKNIN